MRIAGVKAAMPTRVVDNRKIKAMVTEYSGEVLKDGLREVLKRIGYYLRYSGSEQRLWLADDERPSRCSEPE